MRETREWLVAQLEELKALQVAAENGAALHGMTSEEAFDYRKRRGRIKELIDMLRESEQHNGYGG